MLDKPTTANAPSSAFMQKESLLNAHLCQLLLLLLQRRRLLLP
jgi:hypothetical protein